MKIHRTPREQRHLRVRKKVVGTAERPRLGVFRSNNHIYVQVINDDEGKTLAAASTMDKGITLEGGHTSTVAAAREVGKLVARRAQEKGIKRVVFDRGGFIYHGRVAALAEGAREEGLEF
ncbi:MAG TPA: 50S ribosomal protein L18 [Armatimonadota bacterium]|nr:50S ribosomal protein L18 [Armatimonadota bacterium]